ncbi:MAG: hypothetical protein AAFW70_24400 [Cyanobacteria bacterium J06635_10]
MNQNFLARWNDANTSSNFNDLVVEIQPTEKDLPFSTNLQNSSQPELIDLTGLTQTVVNADFSVFREGK